MTRPTTLTGTTVGYALREYDRALAKWEASK